MLADKKVVGGALRLTRKSILYQGTIQLSDQINRATLKANLKSIFEGTI
jgi:lipoate-protein ligase A